MKNIIISLIFIFHFSFAIAVDVDFQFEASQSDLSHISDSFDEEVLNIGGTEITRGDLRRYAGLDDGSEFSENYSYKNVIESRKFQIAISASIVAGILHTVLQAESDKQKHTIVGALIGFGVTRVCEHIFEVKSNFFCALTGTGAAAITAILKELRDSQGHGTVDGMDIVYTIAPGALASFSRPFSLINYKF
jgi:hypothetical protein